MLTSPFDNTKKWFSNIIRGLAVGLLTGVFIYVFASTIMWSEYVNDRLAFLYLFLPLGAVLTYLVYKKIGDRYRNATVQAIDEIHAQINGEKSPENESENIAEYQRKESISPLTGLVGYFMAALSHLLGASIGKEGVGVQIGITTGVLLNKGENLLKRVLKKDSFETNQFYLMSGASAAFGALFGSPISGILFGTQFASPDVTRIDAFLPCTIASYTAVFVVRALKSPIITIPTYMALPFDMKNAAIVALFAIFIGIVAKFFCYALELFKSWCKKLFKKSEIAQVVFPSILIVLIMTVNWVFFDNFDYNGLSEDLLYSSISSAVPYWAFALKALLVFLAIAAGFVGGEVVPLLVFGSTLGFTVSSVLHLNTGAFAVLGAIGMLSGGTNLPVVCFTLGLELFHYNEPWLVFIMAALSYVTSGKRSIYAHQENVVT